MGFFSSLFSSSSNIEKLLEAQYVPMFQTMMGMSLSEAKRTFRDTLKLAKEASQEHGTSRFPANLGEILLEKESTDEQTKSMLDKKRKEGVRDEDIRWWWNLHDLERSMMLKTDDMHRLALFTQLYQEGGLSDEEAGRRVRKNFPMFGDPDDTSITSGKDRPLPYELKDRINIYIEKRAQTDPEQYKKETEESSTFNALIRQEIEKGNI